MMSKRRFKELKTKTALFLAATLTVSLFSGLPAKKAQAAPALSNPVHNEDGTVTWDCVYFGSYWQTDTNNDGYANKQDDKTPIKWRVLSVTGDDVFLLADQILDVQQYDQRYEEVAWENCTMRSWLNGYDALTNRCFWDYTVEGMSFINNAFTPEEQAAIIETVLRNDGNPFTDMDGSVATADTKDKIFLLSIADLTNSAYGFTNYNLVNGSGSTIGGIYFGEGEGDFRNVYDCAKFRTNTDFAGGTSHDNGDYYGETKYGLDTATGQGFCSLLGTGSWWLRSRGQFNSYAMYVNWDTDIYNIGDGVHRETYGVCPALHLKLSSDLWTKAEPVTSIKATHIHSYGEAEITRKPNCGNKGEKTYTCTSCGDKRIEEIPASGAHKWNAGKADAQEKSKITYTCTICGATKTKTANAFGLCDPTADENGDVVYDCLYFGNYWQKDTNNDGKANKKDNKTPIKWRILSVDGDDAFLIADQNLDVQTFNPPKENEGAEASAKTTWADSLMRSWLQDTFLKNAFSEKEQNAILETTLKNNGNPHLNGTADADTKDKLFLLSLEDIANQNYGFSNFTLETEEGNGEPVGMETVKSPFEEGFDFTLDIYDYAKLRTNTDFAGGTDFKHHHMEEGENEPLDTATGFGSCSPLGTNGWWLRTMSEHECVTSVDYFGRVNEYGQWVGDEEFAVCPALHLKLSSLTWTKAGKMTCKSGSYGGTQADVHQLVKVNKVNATCTKPGSKEYWTCSDCHKNFEDSEGKTEIQNIDTWKVIAAKGHKKTAIAATPATTGANGKTAGEKCSVCNTILTSQKTIYKASNIKLSADTFTYNGKAKNPTLTVKDSKGNTIAAKYYTVTKDSGRTKVGTYTYKITFKGNYKGTKKLTFQINPAPVSLKSLTAGSKKLTVKWQKNTKEVTGYEIQYATNKNFTAGAKIVTVKNNKTENHTISKLTAKKKYFVRIRTYKEVSKKKYYSDWSASKNATTKK